MYFSLYLNAKNTDTRSKSLVYIRCVLSKLRGLLCFVGYVGSVGQIGACVE